MSRGRSEKQGSYQEIQEDEAELVANFDGSRCSGAPVIPHRSSVERQQDPDADAFVVLLFKRRQEYVREVRMTKRREKVHKVDRKGVKGYREPVVSFVIVAARRV
jgi:hypothetical protein